MLAELTGSETLALCAVLSRVPPGKMRPMITSLSLKLNFFDDLAIRVGNYSPAALKKLSIAIAIINNPEILICEEPSRGK
jgi:ABC-type multidrug transport system ATPase subunit